MLDQSFRKQRLFGIDFDVVTMREAVDWVFRTVALGHREETQYVVTPNVSITVQHQDSAEFRRMVHHAALTIVDGMPLVTASKWLGKPLPERVAGSDLVFNVFAAAIEEMPLRVFLLGAAEGVANRAASIIHQRWPHVKVVGTCSPPMGFERDTEQNQKILRMINSAEPDVLLVCLGAPKQEAWTFQHRVEIKAAVTLCVGGTIDFIAGKQKRAPEVFRKSGVEWVWRVCTNPRRLWKRYVGDAIRLPRLLLDEGSGLCPVYDGRGYEANPQTRPVTGRTSNPASEVS